MTSQTDDFLKQIVEKVTKILSLQDENISDIIPQLQHIDLTDISKYQSLEYANLEKPLRNLFSVISPYIFSLIPINEMHGGKAKYDITIGEIFQYWSVIIPMVLVSHFALRDKSKPLTENLKRKIIIGMSTVVIYWILKIFLQNSGLCHNHDTVDDLYRILHHRMHISRDDFIAIYGKYKIEIYETIYPSIDTLNDDDFAKLIDGINQKVLFNDLESKGISKQDIYGIIIPYVKKYDKEYVSILIWKILKYLQSNKDISDVDTIKSHVTHVMQYTDKLYDMSDSVDIDAKLERLTNNITLIEKFSQDNDIQKELMNIDPIRVWYTIELLNQRMQWNKDITKQQILDEITGKRYQRGGLTENTCDAILIGSLSTVITILLNASSITPIITELDKLAIKKTSVYIKKPMDYYSNVRSTNDIQNMITDFARLKTQII